MLTADPFFHRILRVWRALAVLFMALAAAGCRRPSPPPPPVATGPTPEESAAALSELTSRAPVKLAWLEGGRLYFFDNVQPSAPRLLRESATQERVVFTPDGAAVLVTDGGEIVAITPTTGESRSLGAGHALAAVRSPESNSDWVYATDSTDGTNLFRFPLHEPEEREPVWNDAVVDPRSAQISRDGFRLTGRFFGQDGGVADLRDRSWIRVSSDRPLTLAPDDSHVAAMLDGTGRRLRFFHPSGEPWDRDSDDLMPAARWQVVVPEAPWADVTARFTDVRWSQHSRFLLLTESGRSGPGPARLALARISPTAHEIESLAVLAAVGPDVRGADAWVGGGAGASLADWTPSPESFKRPETDANGATLRWPTTHKGASFIWDTRHAVNHLPGRQTPCRLMPRGTARFGEWGDLILDGGTFEADIDSARAVAATASASNSFVMQLLVTESTDREGPLSTRLAALQLTGDRDAFSLSRVDHALVLRALLDAGDGSPPREHQSTLSPLAIAASRPFHLLVELRNGQVTWTIDGEQVGDPQAIGPGSLAGWKPDEVTRLIFGDAAMKLAERPDQRPTVDNPFPDDHSTLTSVGWRARLEKIMILDRPLAMTELRDDRANAAATTTRRPGSVIRLRATLLEAPVLPESPASRTRLVQQIYRVEEVLAGQLKVNPITIWHWATLDGISVASRPMQVGATFDLKISPLIRHPETELEATWLGSEGIVEPGYLDVALPQKPPTLAPSSTAPTHESDR
ncbi:MAG: hypothetical protein ACKV19_28295 [Verrucomicrobiales bacterium]